MLACAGAGFVAGGGVGAGFVGRSARGGVSAALAVDFLLGLLRVLGEGLRRSGSRVRGAGFVVVAAIVRGALIARVTVVSVVTRFTVFARLAVVGGRGEVARVRPILAVGGTIA